jgi:5-methylcytosine-specific restriction endonuclease McrA
MARLKALPGRVARLPSRLVMQSGGPAQRDQVRSETQPWRKWYSTARWQKLRWSVLVRDGFTCAICGVTIDQRGALVCDHIVPHRGDADAFWEGPFQTLCKDCHDSAKQAQERAGRLGGGEKLGRG